MSTGYATEGVAPTAQQPTEDLTDALRDHAQSVSDQARARAREQVDRGSAELGTRASSVAEDLSSVAEHLRVQGKAGPAALVEQAARRVAGASDYLQGADGNRILHDAEALGRRRPWTAIAGGLAAGIAASRLLKASSTDRYRTGGHGAGPSAPPAPRSPRPQPLRTQTEDAVGPEDGSASPMSPSPLGSRAE